MTDLQRCPFCESAIPREALYCSRCGGKLPQARAQATAPGIAPGSPTPAPDDAPVAADRVASPSDRASGAGASRASAAQGPGTGSSSTTPTGSLPPGASQSLSISRIQRPGRGLKVALLVLGAAVCVAAGWIAAQWRRPAPISVVAGPGLVELGQPRVAMGADPPDPSRFLDPGTDGGAVAPGEREPVRPRVGPGPAPRPGPQNDGRPSKVDGGGPAAANQQAPANAADGGQPAQGGDPGAGAGADAQHGGGQAGQEGEGEESTAPEGLLDTRAVIYVVRHYLPQVRACYERQLRNAPELRGQITMRFTVGAGGRVTGTSVVVNSTGSDALATCVSSNLRTWRFPEPEGGPVSFEYPFRFGSPSALPELPGATQDP